MTGWSCHFSNLLDSALRMDDARCVMEGGKGSQRGQWVFLFSPPACVTPFFPLLPQIRMQLSVNTPVNISALRLSFVSTREASRDGSGRLRPFSKISLHNLVHFFASHHWWLLLIFCLGLGFHPFWQRLTLHPFKVTVVRQPSFAYLREQGGIFHPLLFLLLSFSKELGWAGENWQLYRSWANDWRTVSLGKCSGWSMERYRGSVGPWAVIRKTWLSMARKETEAQIIWQYDTKWLSEPYSLLEVSNFDLKRQSRDIFSISLA